MFEIDYFALNYQNSNHSKQYAYGNNYLIYLTKYFIPKIT